jgi:hypothetical protein
LYRKITVAREIFNVVLFLLNFFLVHKSNLHYKSPVGVDKEIEGFLPSYRKVPVIVTEAGKERIGALVSFHLALA